VLGRLVISACAPVIHRLWWREIHLVVGAAELGGVAATALWQYDAPTVLGDVQDCPLMTVVEVVAVGLHG
jgi:hypothetical protein